VDEHDAAIAGEHPVVGAVAIPALGAAPIGVPQRRHIVRVQARHPQRRVGEPLLDPVAEHRLDLGAHVQQVAGLLGLGSHALHVDHARQLLDEAPIALLDLGPALLGELVLGDLHHQPAHDDRVPLVVPHGVADVAEPHDGAVAVQEPVLHVVRAPLGDARQERLERAFAVVRVEVIGPEARAVDPHLRRVAEHVPRALAHEREAPGRGVGLPDHGVEVADEGPQASQLAAGTRRRHDWARRGEGIIR
jgi:hypothetical protein